VGQQFEPPPSYQQPPQPHERPAMSMKTVAIIMFLASWAFGIAYLVIAFGNLRVLAFAAVFAAFAGLVTQVLCFVFLLRIKERRDKHHGNYGTNL
jgi:hypothetical protein